MPAAAPRPTNAARAKATEPAISALTAMPAPKRTRPPGGTSSPGNVAKTAPVAQAAAAMAAAASGQRGDVAGELLERDERAREGRDRDEVEAAPAGLAGERPGEGEDRPEAGQERQVGRRSAR